MDKDLSKLLFEAAPGAGEMDYKDHAAAWSASLWDILCRDNLHEGPLAERALELGLLSGHSCPRRFLRGLEHLRAVRSNERNGFQPVAGEV